MTASSRTLQKSAIFFRSPLGTSRSERQSRMSGWMPIERSSFTECCVGLVLSSPADEMNGTSVRWMKTEECLRQLVPELADGLEKGQALDVADGAADLDQHEVDAVVAGDHELLDGVGDVRDHLHGAAEIIAAPLAGEDVLVDAPGGDVVRSPRRDAGEALVVAEVEIGLRPVVGDEHLPVLVGAHGAGVDVQVGVELAQAHGIAARLKEGAESRRCKAFSEGGDHAAGNEDVPLHGL